MKRYRNPNKGIWHGRVSNKYLYLHEKVRCVPLREISEPSKKSIVLLGYGCDEGVKRNQGRIGAAKGSEVIKRSLGKFPNHLASTVLFHDAGTITCEDKNMEAAQEALSKAVTSLLEKKQFPIVLGGGHDMAYGHYKGIRNHVNSNHTIGIINFDAHFDLRSNKYGNNSGTPFYQIAKDCETYGIEFKYLCLGIRKDANDHHLFETAENLNVSFIENTEFKTIHKDYVVRVVKDFIQEVHCVYATIDLDGFSSTFTPGVSAPSPMGFAPDIVLETLQIIIDSKKLMSLDIAEMNPLYDRDNQTAILAASLIHFVIHGLNQR